MRSEASIKLKKARDGSYVVRLPLVEVLVSLVFAAILPFGFGRWGPSLIVTVFMQPDADSGTLSCPVPTLPSGKTPPKFAYTGSTFEGNVSWSQRHVDSHLFVDPEVHKAANESTEECIEEDDDEEEETEFNPAGQHLMLDIENVDASFLLDVERLADSMIQVVRESQLTLLSYHCHDLKAPMGVSCVGVLLESHVSLHTFPSAGVIAIDLFTCGSGSLLPLVTQLQNLFGIVSMQQQKTTSQPSTRWIHKKRGFRYEDEAHYNPETIDLEEFLLGYGAIMHKELVVSEKTNLQNVQVFEISYRTNKPLDRGSQDFNNENNKKLFLDGVAQSTLHGLEAYHEALVHPALFSHPNPKRVAIIGGGEGATLREVLKHNSVEKCVMVEIDSGLVNLSESYLGEWNDCSNLREDGATKSCFKDERAEIYFQDALAWFIEHYGSNATLESEKFDVVIMDALDPSSLVPFSDKLYAGVEFLGALLNSLSESGILIAQTGESSYENDPALEKTREGKPLNAFINYFSQTRAEVMKLYSESHGQFFAPWEFRMILMREAETANFHSNPAELNLHLAKRAVRTSDGHFPFHYFDGATMQDYQAPTRIVENQFCASEPRPKACEELHGFDPANQNIPGASLEVGVSKIPNAGRGVFFKGSFPKGSYIAIDDGTQALLLEPHVVRTCQKMQKSRAGAMWRSLDFFMIAYGFSIGIYGEDSFVLDNGINNFINHGCNSTFVTDAVTSVNEQTADPARMPDDTHGEESYFFDPFVERNHLVSLIANDRLIVDVERGQELLDNYVKYLKSENWASLIMEYRAQCSNEGVGSATACSSSNLNATKTGKV